MTRNHKETLFALAAALFIPAAAASTAFTPNSAQAETPNQDQPLTNAPLQTLDDRTIEQVIQYASVPHIAYVKPRDERMNRAVHSGMQALQDFMTQKTSLEPAENIVALDLDSDTLIPFKFIYWPIYEGDKPLSDTAQQKVQDFIRARKIILFDNRTRNPDNEGVVQNILGDINMGVMEPLSDSHPLTSVFYNVTNMPGSLNIGRVSVQARSASMSESVSSIIIGSRDWARAWSGISVDKKGQDMALRAAANTVLYAYTGNYKLDQTIIQDSLQRINE